MNPGHLRKKDKHTEASVPIALDYFSWNMLFHNQSKNQAVQDGVIAL
jgi:hypothetical protein